MKYIHDDGKVRLCTINVAKMNVLEYIYYSLFHWRYLQKTICRILKYISKLVESVLGLGIETIKFIMFPIFIIIYAVLDIRTNKKIVEKKDRKSQNKVT